MQRIIAHMLDFSFSFLERTGSCLISMCAGLGDWCRFVWDSLQWSVRKPFRADQVLKQMEFVGVKSIWIIALTSFFTGAVFALQTGKVYALFNMESMVGATVAMSLAREIAPVFTAIMITARACSSMAAELGTMRVTEQIDALETMAVSPLQYLVVPRIIACSVMVPMLTMVYNYIGVVGSYIVSIYLLGIDAGPFFGRMYYYVDADDIYGGLIKAAIFGFLIAAISCYMGFNTRGGAKGVGRATTRAVVFSAVTVLVTDYFLTTWIIEYISK
ncbi:MAG TPA: ABC transporter permease [bacterium]|nr:MAG: putative phospholipid ABC transporter permease protein MlaE [bacterium ADurb.Bin270]HPW45036.1 ABC transporter permease [bacterium]